MHVQYKDFTFNIQRKSESVLLINNQEVNIDGSNSSKIEFNGKTFNVELVADENGKKKIYVNNFLLDFEVKTDLEHKLDQMGIVAADGIKASDIVAPMPGKIIDVLVEKDETVEKGQAVIILEAMKMENGIKIDFDAEIKDVLIAVGDTVEKGEKLLLLK